MFKHIIAIILLSAIVVLTMPYAQTGIEWLVSGHDWIAEVLTNLFTGGQAGNIAKGLIAILAIPLLAGLIPAIIYWMVKRNWLPCFMEIVWIIWLLQAGALIALYRAPVIS